MSNVVRAPPDSFRISSQFGIFVRLGKLMIVRHKATDKSEHFFSYRNLDPDALFLLDIIIV